MRDAGSDRDGADLHVSVIDVPAFLAGISGAAAGEGGHSSVLRRNIGRRLAFQNPGLLNHAREIRDRLFVDGRRLGHSRLPDFRQVAVGQDYWEMGRHAV
jgi:hypothetical protein